MNMTAEYKYRLKKIMLLLAASVMMWGRVNAFTVNNPNMSISPAVFELLKTLHNQQGQAVIKITNDGNDLLRIFSIAHANPAFTIAPSSFDLPSGVSQDVTVTFTPGSHGIFSDSLTINSNTGVPVIYKIKGIGVYSPVPYMGLSANGFSFGALKAGNTAKKTVMITNFGVVDMVISSITLSGNTGGAFSVTPQSKTIASGDSAAIEISFNPLQTADYTASMKFNVNAVNSSELIQLSGKGVSGAAPECSVSKSTVYFGHVKAGRQSAQDLVIMNTGLEELTVNSITPDNAIFTVDAQAFTLPSGESKTLKITFSPLSEGAYNNKLTIIHNAVSSPSSIYLNASSFIYSPSITLNTSISFADVNDIRNYRIIGLPGKIDIPLSQVLSGRAEFDWNAVWDNGQSTNYKVKYDGTAKFNFRAGNAFWIISRSPFRVNKITDPVVLSPENDYSIPLNAGWNLISNPFDKDVNWTDVRQSNSLPSNAVIYSWNGVYIQAQVFAPYQGYYFYNATGLDSLKIPYKTSAALSKGAASGGMNQLIIEAGNELAAAAPVRLGLDRNASEDYDELDYLMPPGDFESAGIRIFSSGLSLNYKYLSCEMRQGSGEGDVFDLKVKNETGRDLTLRFKGAGQFGSREVLLAVKGLSGFTDLKVCSEVTVPAGYKCRDYSVIIGSRKFTESMQKLQVPEDFAVMQNYPNPFNPSTSIRYSLPAACRVEISIYNMLGEKIAQLKNGFEEAGPYEVSWDAGGFSSGIYFCSVSAGQTDGAAVFKDVRKMVLVK